MRCAGPLLLFVACLSLSSVAADPANGARLWRDNCVTCHGPAPDDRRRARGSTPEDLRRTFSAIGAMTYLATFFSASEYEDLAAYIRVDPADPGTAPAFDVTGLWFMPEEPGWGMSLTEHRPTSRARGVLGVLFLYDVRGFPLWLIFPDGRWRDGQLSGPLYEVRGAGPAAAPAPLRTQTVGSVTLAFESKDSVRLRFDVDTARVERHMVRLRF